MSGFIVQNLKSPGDWLGRDQAVADGFRWGLLVHSRGNEDHCDMFHIMGFVLDGSPQTAVGGWGVHFSCSV